MMGGLGLGGGDKDRGVGLRYAAGMGGGLARMSRTELMACSKNSVSSVDVMSSVILSLVTFLSLLSSLIFCLMWLSLMLLSWIIVASWECSFSSRFGAGTV